MANRIQTGTIHLMGKITGLHRYFDEPSTLEVKLITSLEVKVKDAVSGIELSHEDHSMTLNQPSSQQINIASLTNPLFEELSVQANHILRRPCHRYPARVSGAKLAPIKLSFLDARDPESSSTQRSFYRLMVNSRGRSWSESQSR